MNRKEFFSLGIGGAAASIVGCMTSSRHAEGEIRNVRAESPELQSQKRRALESARELGYCFIEDKVDW